MLTTPPNRWQVYGRPLVILWLSLFVVSVSLLLFASTRPFDQLPAWAGPVDVAAAFAVVILAIVIQQATGNQMDNKALYAGYYVGTTLPAVSLVAIWYFREQLLLNTLLPGVAWRSFILLYSLPYLLTAWRMGGAGERL